MDFTTYRSYDALGLADLVKTKEVKAEELLEIALKRIGEVNPRINAVVHDLSDLGRSMLKQNAGQGIFSGVPFLIKDLGYHIKGYPLTKGSAGWKNYISEEDGHLTKELRKAGLIFLGRTNTPELGLAPFTEPELYGPTRNPWNTDRSAGGSSGGSGAAVAAGVVPMATASDGGGSIRIPASCNGLFGIKPSRGRLSYGPQSGEGWAGAVVDNVVSRSVRDSAAFLDTMMGYAPGDPYLIQKPERSYMEELEQTTPKLKIGFSTQHTLGSQIDPECVKAVEETAKLLQDLGHEVEEVQLPYYKEDLTKTFLYIVLTETAATVDELRHHLGRKIVPGKDVEPNTYIQYLLGKTFSGMEYAICKRKWNEICRRVAQYHQRYDLLLTSVVATPPFEIGALQPTPAEKRLVSFINTVKMGSLVRANIEQLADKIFQYIPYTAFANMTGQPSMSVPLHWTAEGLPVGLMFSAAMGREDTLFRLAKQLEEAKPWFDNIPKL
jgi:amidase